MRDCKHWVLMLSALYLCSCSATERHIDFATIENVSLAAVEQGRRIAEDPEGFLRDSLERCESLASYEVDFYKQERVAGLFGEILRPEEHMRAKFRAEPFSVKMTMLNESHEFSETLYVEGQNKDMLRCRWRKAILPGGEPPVNDYPPQFAVQFGKSINPITDFGVARLMQRVLRTLEQATTSGAAPSVVYRGLTEFEKDALPVHHVRLQYPGRGPVPNLRVDLLFHVDSLLPAASYVRPDGKELQGRYIYTRFDLDVQFSDADFRLSEARPIKTAQP